MKFLTKLLLIISVIKIVYIKENTTFLTALGATPIRLNCTAFANFKVVLEGLVDLEAIFKEFDGKTRRQCTLECLSNAQCVALNYQLNIGKCQLLNRGITGAVSSLVNKAGWVYMTTDEEDSNVGPNCMRLSPCLKGKCVDTCANNGYKCICNSFYYGKHCDKMIQDCRGVYESGKTQNGVYTIFLAHTQTTMEVYCDMVTANKQWIVFQRRVNNTVDFYRNWKAYKDGFGSLSGNFWFGLDKINLLAGPNRMAKLRVDVRHRALGSTIYYAKYKVFEIGNEAEKYKLLIGGFSGTAGDAMAKQNKMKFSTFDNDNDLGGNENCASHWRGAWWYQRCHHSNLNGIFPTTSSTSAMYMSWLQLRSSFGSIVYSEMKITYE